MPKRKTVLVTGANGFVGSKLCKFLLGKGFFVVGVSLHSTSAAIKGMNRDTHFVFTKSDIRNFNEINAVVKKYRPNAIFHTAAKISEQEKDELDIFNTNVLGTLNVLQSAARNNVQAIIHSSSMAVYGLDVTRAAVDERHALNPVDIYALSKVQAEELCTWYAKNRGLNVAILRYSGIYGLGKKEGAVARFTQNAMSGALLEVGRNVLWDIVYVDDVVKANFLAFKKINTLKLTIVNIGSGESITVVDLAKKIVRLCKSTSRVDVKSKKLALQFTYNINKAKKLLGFKPMLIEQGLKNYIKNIL